jgi:hypothetical protein
MRTVVLVALVTVAACGSKKPSTTPDPGSGSGSEEPPVITVQTLLGWGTQGYNPDAATPRTKIFLEVTDHHGATQSYPLGEIAAPCSPQPGNGADIVTVLACNLAGTGAEFRAVYRGNDVIVLRRWVTPDDDPAEAELSFQEVSRIPVATGSKVKPAG